MSFLGKLLSLSIACASIALAFASAGISGAGMWTWLILGSGVFIGFSPYTQWSITLGKVVAAFLGMISFGAFALGMVAGTIGSGLDRDDQAFLFLFLLVSLLCLGFLISQRKPPQPTSQDSTAQPTEK